MAEGKALRYDEEATALGLSEVGGDDGRAQADDPVAEHGPLPGRPGHDRPGRVPGRRGVLDLAAAYADEVARLAALGCTYLQFDDTSLAYYLNDPVRRAEIAARGDAEHSKRRIVEAAQFIPLDQLCLSGQCGFSSTVGGQRAEVRRGSRQARAHRQGRPGRLRLSRLGLSRLG